MWYLAYEWMGLPFLARYKTYKELRKAKERMLTSPNFKILFIHNS
jgi:hypothetical protein